LTREKVGQVKAAIKNWPAWRRWLLIGGFLLLAFFAWRWFSAPSEADKKKIAAVKADPRVICEGIVVPVRYASMSLQLSGVVSEVLAKEGDQVKPGQVLIRLANEDLLAKAQSARAGYLRETAGFREQEVAMKKAGLEQAAASQQQAKIDFQRLESLHGQNAVSRQEYDKGRTNWLKARSDWERAKADYEMAIAGSRSETIAAARADAEAAEAAVGQTVLRAPFAGTVAYLDHKVGEYVAAGTPLVRLGEFSAWRIQTDDLTELQIAKVREGAKVSLTFEGLPGLELAGKVTSIRAFGEKKRGDITYTVYIDPERHEPLLKWSMTAIVKIEPLQ
jgi:HlyD family secretion protein